MFWGWDTIEPTTVDILFICQNPWNYAAQRLNLSMQIKKKHLGDQEVLGGPFSPRCRE